MYKRICLITYEPAILILTTKFPFARWGLYENPIRKTKKDIKMYAEAVERLYTEWNLAWYTL